MKGIEIRALTENGSKTIKQAFLETRNAPLPQRKAYALFYAEAIISEKPFTIRIESKTGIGPAVLASIFDENLKNLGLKKNKDYKVIVDE